MKKIHCPYCSKEAEIDDLLKEWHAIKRYSMDCQERYMESVISQYESKGFLSGRQKETIRDILGQINEWHDDMLHRMG